MVVAHAETHGRPHTRALLEGFVVIPHTTVPYRGTTVAGMDLGAVLAHRPRVALLDDFADRNVPGARHAWRWQDAAVLLAAGIDVISTVRVDHLDSLADVVANITGATPRQSVPDPVVRAADEVEMVDLAPEVLRDRMGCGHIYAPPEAEEALGTWFQTGNLSALRELALLWLATTLASDRGRAPESGCTSSPARPLQTVDPPSAGHRGCGPEDRPVANRHQV
jgi:two-component system sensor histidine kinase KdpD